MQNPCFYLYFPEILELGQLKKNSKKYFIVKKYLSS